MKIVSFFFGFFFLSQLLLAQKNKYVEIGAAGGVFYYLGDVNPSLHFYNPQSAYGGYFKLVLNEHYSTKIGVAYGTIAGSDNDFNNTFSLTRGHSFTNTIADIHLMGEFNFFPLLAEPDEELYKNFTTYICAGLSYYIAPNSLGSTSNLGIPFGVGVKYNLSKRFNIGAEWVMRYTLNDNLDLLEPVFRSEKGGAFAGKQKSFTGNNDSFTFVGVNLGVKLYAGNDACPAYGRKKSKKK
ncbi:MAG TPA: hypothetical protein DCQ31_11595 [Bacteroidales bacterium]|nr:hypothetical protein [Bacteroidales bacterium]